jgi:ABC-type branched-subunit amino acid transport system ATPase component
MDNLRCIGLSKSFDGIQALAQLDLNLPQEGITAIIGPNGAGKTTLLHVITGFIRPDTGKCFLGQKELTRLQPHQIAHLGVTRTFQDLRLILQVSTLENIMLARPHQRGEGMMGALFRVGVAMQESQNREEALRLLHFVGLNEKVNSPASELSYGQQKLLSLACCLATNATTLLLDEPLSGVDPEMRSRILELLQNLREQGKVIIFIEHDISAVQQVAEMLVVMDHGKVIAQGHPREILESTAIMEAYLA